MHLAKLADTITVPMARASILWLIGEYSDRVPKIAPDVLRKMAKGFINEVSEEDCAFIANRKRPSPCSQVDVLRNNNPRENRSKRLF